MGGVAPLAILYRRTIISKKLRRHELFNTTAIANLQLETGSVLRLMHAQHAIRAVLDDLQCSESTSLPYSPLQPPLLLALAHYISTDKVNYAIKVLSYFIPSLSN